MLRIKDNADLVNVECPKCGQGDWTMTECYYSEPFQFVAKCNNCDYKIEGEGPAIKVLEGEEGVRLRPYLYLGCDDLKLRKLAEELIAESEKTKDELLDLCRSFIKENTISCPETIHQSDWIQEDALDFIESVANIVGYFAEEDK